MFTVWNTPVKVKPAVLGDLLVGWGAWTLVERGRTSAQADAVVRRLNLVIGAVALVAGVVLAVLRYWLPGLGLAAGGAIATGAGLDKVR